MKGKIGIEEHFALPDTLEGMPAGQSNLNALSQRLLDMFAMRIEEMDKHGMDMMILSLNSPAIQETHVPARAVDLAKRCNDHLAETIQRHPTRFRGFAALPMQDPDAAIRELERCVRDLGFLGALVNGYSQIDSPSNAVYLDDKRYWPFWAKVSELNVPFYLHPRDPLPEWQRIYEGHPWLLAATWGFTVETATHALRLMCSGIFDKHPNLTLILGHLGECIPHHIWRSQNRLERDPRPKPFKKPLGDYLRENVYITTSGNFFTPALVNCITVMGPDRVMFSTDYPFEPVGKAAAWFDNIEMDEAVRRKIGRDNAVRLFNLK